MFKKYMKAFLIACCSLFVLTGCGNNSNSSSSTAKTSTPVSYTHLDVYKRQGLIYEINLDESGHCKIVMTFTDTACDCAESLPIAIMDSLKKIDEIESVSVEVTWSPAWKITRISRFGRIALGISPK